MDTTMLARRLLATAPVHRTVRLEVGSAVDGQAAVRIGNTAGLTNPFGALHPSGLITLIDAAGVAAMIAAAEDDDAFTDVSVLGAAASLEFRRPALGPVTAVSPAGTAQRGPLAIAARSSR